MKQINLALNVEEINLLLEALGNLPFIKVHELIGKIHQQARPQVAADQNAAGMMDSKSNADAAALPAAQVTEE